MMVLSGYSICIALYHANVCVFALLFLRASNAPSPRTWYDTVTHPILDAPPRVVVALPITGTNAIGASSPPPPSPAAGIWGVPRCEWPLLSVCLCLPLKLLRRKSQANVTAEPFKTRPPGPMPPFGKHAPGYIPDPKKVSFMISLSMTLNLSSLCFAVL